MSTELARLGLYIDSSGVVRATKELGKLEKQGKQTEGKTKDLTKSAISMGKAFGVAAGAGIAALAVSTLNTNREFESLKTSLLTVTGNMELAEVAFSGLQAFAARTPFSVKELTDAFIKLGNLGLAPSERALTSYGNTAGAMGKSLNQMIEAVADATTGEFERLKEFGIKSKSEGDRVTFTFKGMSKEVGKNASEIQQYLLNLGETDFAGGMDRQANTVNGAISNLGDSWDIFLDNLLDKDAEQRISNAFRFLGDSIDWLDSKINGTISFDTLTADAEAAMNKINDLISRRDNTRNGPLKLKLNVEIEQAQADLSKIESAIWSFGMTSGETFDDVANKLGKVGDSAVKTFTSFHEGLSLSDDVLASLNDEIDIFIEKNEAISDSYDSVTTSLSEQLTMMGMTAREAAIYQAQLQLSAGATDDMRENVRRLSGDLYDEKKALEDINVAAKEHEEQLKRMERQSEDWSSSFADAMLDSTSSFSDFTESVIKQLAKIAIQQLTQPAFSAFGDLISGVFSSSVGSAALPAGGGAIHLSSYDGGGFTGEGSRSGGVDGKGGFPAILHPNESVVDHTQKQSPSASVSSRPVIQNITIDARGAQPGMEQKIRAAAEEGARKGYMMVLDDVRRNGAIRGALR